MLVTDLINVRYLSGFTGSAGALIVFADDRPAVLATDGRYRAQAARQAPDLEIAIQRSGPAYLVSQAEQAGARRLGFEAHVVTVDGFDALSVALKPALTASGAVDIDGEVQWVRTSYLVESLREVKDAGEVALLRLACEAADAALADLIERGGIRPGRTERQVARDLESLMLDHGADAPSFETIVAAGANSAIPHHRPTSAVLATGDFVKIDFGALVAGYHSDMTRTFVLGSPADWQREIYQVVEAAQRAGRHAARPGAALREVDAAARTVIEQAGYGETFGHGLGHGVGLRIHEAPGINAAADGTLLSGAVVTVEPGVYLADRGGVRIEDTLVVAEETPDGISDGPSAPVRAHQELLTRFPKELTIL